MSIVNVLGENDDIRYDVNDLPSGTFVKYISKGVFELTDELMNMVQDLSYGIIVRDVDSELIGIYDVDCKEIYTDYENYTIIKIYELKRFEIEPIY